MSILDRLQLLVRSEWSARASAREERRALVAEARRSLADIMADERRLRLAYQDALDEAHRLHERAERLLAEGNERAARSSLMDRERVLRDVEAIRVQVEKQQTLMVELQGAVDTLASRESGSATEGSSRASTPAADVSANPDSWQWPSASGGGSSASGSGSSEFGGSTSSAQSAGPPRFEAIGGGTRTLPADAGGGGPRSPLPAARGELEIEGEAFERFEEMGGRIEMSEARLEAERMLASDAKPGSGADPLEERFRRMETERRLRRLRERVEDGEGGEDGDPPAG